MKANSPNSTYILSVLEDEIVVNPTLTYKLKNDFDFNLPEFDSSKDKIENYFTELETLIQDKSWEIIKDVNLTTLSFQKINMYKDLERNVQILESNDIINAIARKIRRFFIPNELIDYNHDTNTRYENTFQVVDADSSQQDAILLSKNGVNFVLQGPPGTGKSQTITNIIAEALADGRKVLFVSEKMAALQIVHKRLESVGLSDFCLGLHSHKANRKDILEDLKKSISLNRMNVRDDIISRLNDLEDKRKILNNYQRELHTPCSELNCTIYKVNGELAKLHDVPDIIFTISDVEKVTLLEMEERTNLLSRISKTIGRSEDDSQTVWRNARIDFLSQALRQDIDSKISLLLPQLKEIDEYFDECCQQLGLSFNCSLERLDTFIQLLTLVARSPIIPTKWILEGNIEQLRTEALQYKETTAKITELESYILERYSEQILSINGQECKRLLTELQLNICQKLKYDSTEAVIANLDNTLQQITSILFSLSELSDMSTKIAGLLGISEPINLSATKFIVTLSEALSFINKTTESWFDIDKFNTIKSDMPKCQTLHEDVITRKHEVLKRFDKDVFGIDFYPMLKRFRGEYGTLFRRFDRNYKADIKILKQHLSVGSKLNYVDALKTLNSLKDIVDKTQEINNNNATYSSYFGSYYKEFDTSWELIKESIENFDKIASLFLPDSIPSQLKSLLLSQTLPKAELSELRKMYLNCNDILETLNGIINDGCNEDTPYAHISEILQSINDNGTQLSNTLQEVRLLREQNASFEIIMEDLAQLEHYQALRNNIELNNETISNRFDTYYEGTNTNWDNTLGALSFAEEFNQFIDDNNPLPEEFIRKICEDHEVVSYCMIFGSELCNLKTTINETINWVIEKFEESENLTQCDFKNLSDRLLMCKNQMNLLEEWGYYRSNRSQYEQMGLSEFIKKVENKIEAKYIVNVYLKRFYGLWLDAMQTNFPAVKDFAGEYHEQTVKEFQDLDKNQFEIAQLRVRERVINRMPDFNDETSTFRDEIGILRTELNRRRNFKSLRKLFKEIPNLLTSLRPCFMMSPLSVSVFLDANSYNFDLVIFDEASQVRTEDAIGAIMRGKQVIIVGDDKQLPPTDFYKTLLADGTVNTDDDTDNTNADAGDYESILNHALTVLPERSLRWHYRSRHEHLITFSNIKIYDNSLITFPSAVEKAPDCGVEYIYVKDGVYDGGEGHGHDNVDEAQKVAFLVFEHFNKFPDRSLGVVTFSEAQQQAVDSAIWQRRRQDKRYEEYFNEDRDEPFFIKNLENVQGDERDTIILSICYAKRNDGRMYMNFGPLSKQDGYRRLNVAITRAKHNIKLVGSILPTDINTDQELAEGVRLLRSYIEFAQQGIIALQNELTFTHNVNCESPFEKAVYEFLDAKGYKVITQVGCSEYRIDMAVKHPTKSGIFVIGIECDGATYHSSRTARDRDRLRQTVLEDKGWTIYRIWSTHWIRNQRTEEQKLVNAIEEAMKRFPIHEANIVDETVENSVNNTTLTEIEEVIDLNKIDQEDFGFQPYLKINIDDYSDILNTQIIIKKVIEIEQPIHFDVLCQRVESNHKVTKKSKKKVKTLLRDYLSNDIECSDDFYRIRGFNEIIVRGPSIEGGYIRPLAHICDEELGKAMILILERRPGITLDNLSVVTARKFGFNNKNKNIDNTLRRVYNTLLTNEEIKEVDGRCSITREL